jgi:hypothetical protein
MTKGENKMMVDRAGYYQARVVKVDYGYSKGGSEQIIVVFEVVDEGPQHGRFISWFGYFTEKAIYHTFDLML